MKKIVITLMLILSAILIAGCTQQTTTQTTNLEQQQFCNNLNLDIRPIIGSPNYAQIAEGKLVEFCIYSSENDNARLLIKLKDSREFTSDETLQAGSCVVHQITPMMSIGFGDVSYIKVTSKSCSNVDVIEVNMTNLGYNPQPLQQTVQTKANLKLDNWTLISGWEQFLTNLGNNNFNVPSHSSDALFIEPFQNSGNVDINDLIENIACNVVSGDVTILSKFDYDGFDCLSSDCSLLQTENIKDANGNTIGTIGKKIRLPAGGTARLNLRFFDKSGYAKFVSQYTTVSCNVNMYSQSDPEISSQSKITIYFNS